MRLRAFRLLWVASAVLFPGCGGDSSTAPSATPPTTPPTTLFTLTAPAPLAPPPNAVIPQNDPATGCDVQSPTVGYGHRIEFSWVAPQSSVGVDRYELFAAHVGAPLPIVNTSLRGTTYRHVSCDAYVTDINLNNWEWKVRAVDRNGTIGPWSDAIPFRFAPCRVGRSACYR